VLDDVTLMELYWVLWRLFGRFGWTWERDIDEVEGNL
jgi:hypothetical protein